MELYRLAAIIVPIRWIVLSLSTVCIWATGPSRARESTAH